MNNFSSWPLPRAHRRGRDARRQNGFTLVELMVSMVLGLLIVLALLTLLINVNRNNSEMTKANRVIENGRFALQLLQADVSHAGFWGGYMPAFDNLTNLATSNDVPTAVPDPCLALPGWDAAYRNNLVGIPVQSHAIGSVTLAVCAGLVTNPQPSSDVLVVRHLETCVAGVDPGCGAPTAGNVYFQSNRCGTPTFVLEPYPADPATVDAVFPLKKRAVTPPGGLPPDCTDVTVPFEDKRKLVSNLYYVRNFAVAPGDGLPTLMRSEFTAGAQQPPQALIEGVESFRVEFGIDNVSDSGAVLTTATFNTSTGVGAAVVWANPAILTSPTNRGDGIPDAYVRCTNASPCTPFQLMNAVSAKLYVLVRSETRTPGYKDTKSYCLASSCPDAADRLGPFDDGFKRHLFTQTVRLVNVSARRETPP
jgi:type IV pilus assembly protein PilW